jgi:hypothetical protein
MKLLQISLIGFSTFFSCIITFKFFAYYTNLSSTLTFDINDIYFSFIGSVLFPISELTKKVIHNLK